MNNKKKKLASSNPVDQAHEGFVGQAESEQLPKEKLKLTIPLKLKKHKRTRPQIMIPKGTVKLPSDNLFDLTMTLKNDNKEDNGLLRTYCPTNDRNTRKKFFGYKVKKNKFMRSINERRVELLEVGSLCPNYSEAPSASDQEEKPASAYKWQCDVLSDIDSTLDCSDDENVQNKSSSVKSAKPLLFDRTIGYKTSAGSSRTESQKIKFYSIAVNMKN